jgi:hypothetical protein
VRLNVGVVLSRTDRTSFEQRRNIEILKVRFGETALQVCEVMLKDMTDSRRTDDHVQSQRLVRLCRRPAFSASITDPCSLSSIPRSYRGTFGLLSKPATSPCLANSKCASLFARTHLPEQPHEKFLQSARAILQGVLQVQTRQKTTVVAASGNRPA